MATRASRRVEPLAERHLVTPDQADRVAALEQAGKTVVVVLQGAQALGMIALRDQPRPDARAGLERLQSLGVRCSC